MLDCRFDDVVILDGSGRPGAAGQVGIRDGRLVAVGRCDEPARRVIHGDGAALAPGFVDIHVHYDAQASWDPALSPSCLHGVTTVVGGNCGFSLAPMAPQHSRYIAEMLARVEGMPIAALVDGVAWDWTGFGEWLGRLDGKLGVNAGFFVGHSTVRRYVMGDAASERSATDGEIAAMVGEVDRALDAWCSRPVDLSDRDPSRRAGSSGAVAIRRRPRAAGADVGPGWSAWDNARDHAPAPPAPERRRPGSVGALRRSRWSPLSSGTRFSSTPPMRRITSPCSPSRTPPPNGVSAPWP